MLLVSCSVCVCLSATREFGPLRKKISGCTVLVKCEKASHSTDTQKCENSSEIWSII